VKKKKTCFIFTSELDERKLNEDINRKKETQMHPANTDIHKIKIIVKTVNYIETPRSPSKLDLL